MSDTNTIAFLVAPEGIERVELTEPWQAVEDADLHPVLISTSTGMAQTFDHLDKSETKRIDRVVESTSVNEYDALVLPGGVANPDALRMSAEAVSFIRSFVESGKPVAAICHAPWTLIEADVVRGRTLTSWPSLQTDIRNAGGTWVDEPLVVDGNLITSRKPDDLPEFVSAILDSVKEASAAGSKTG